MSDQVQLIDQTAGSADLIEVAETTLLLETDTVTSLVEIEPAQGAADVQEEVLVIEEEPSMELIEIGIAGPQGPAGTGQGYEVLQRLNGMPQLLRYSDGTTKQVSYDAQMRPVRFELNKPGQPAKTLAVTYNSDGTIASVAEE